MKSNIGPADKTIRIILAATILYFSSVVSGRTAAVLAIVASLLIVTSLIGYCPLYALLKINTIKEKK